MVRPGPVCRGAFDVQVDGEGLDHVWSHAAGIAGADERIFQPRDGVGYPRVQLGEVVRVDLAVSVLRSGVVGHVGVHFRRRDVGGFARRLGRGRGLLEECGGGGECAARRVA